MPVPAPDVGVSPEENIGGVIESLRKGMGGPDAWMAAAALYRRRGLHKHALAVVDTMLEGDYLFSLFSAQRVRLDFVDIFSSSYA